MGIAKVIIGLALVIIGLWLILPSSWCSWISADFVCLAWWMYLKPIVFGVVPVFLVFIGAILVWIETEEMKLQRPKKR